MANRSLASVSVTTLLFVLPAPALANDGGASSGPPQEVALLFSPTEPTDTIGRPASTPSEMRRNERQRHVPDHCFEPSPLSRSETEALLRRAARSEGIDPDLAVAVARRESQMGRARVSPAGAMGTMQMMPDTARDLGVADPCDPFENVPAGVRYLRALLDRFNDPVLALAAYNAGPTRVVAHGGVPDFPETRAYVAAVLAEAESLTPKAADARVGVHAAASAARAPVRDNASRKLAAHTAVQFPLPATDDDPWVDGIVQHF